MSHWLHMMVDGAEFWISCKRPAFLSSFSSLQVIQNLAPSTIALFGVNVTYEFANWIMNKQTNFKFVLKNKFRIFTNFLTNQIVLTKKHKQKNQDSLDNIWKFEIRDWEFEQRPSNILVSRTSKIYVPFIGSAAVCVPISRNLK